MNWKRISKSILPIFCVVQCLFFLPAMANTTDATKLFGQGNEAYTRGHFDQAEKAYLSIVGDNIRSFKVFYNLGNVYYRKGDLAKAILYFEKARLMEPGNKDVKANLALANSKLADKLEAPPEFFLFRIWRGAIMLLSLRSFSWLSIACIVLASAAFIAYLFAHSVQAKKAGFYSGLGLLSLGIICLFLANRQSAFLDANREAIVLRATLSVKTAPDVTAKDVFILHAGSKVKVDTEESGWYKIELPNGNAGWAPAADLGTI